VLHVTVMTCECMYLTFVNYLIVIIHNATHVANNFEQNLTTNREKQLSFVQVFSYPAYFYNKDRTSIYTFQLTCDKDYSC